MSSEKQQGILAEAGCAVKGAGKATEAIRAFPRQTHCVLFLSNLVCFFPQRSSLFVPFICVKINGYTQIAGFVNMDMRP